LAQTPSRPLQARQESAKEIDVLRKSARALQEALDARSVAEARASSELRAAQAGWAISQTTATQLEA